MSWVAVAVVGAGAIGAIGSAYISSQAAGSAAQTQADAASRASDAQLLAYLQAREDLSPWRKTGAGAVGLLEQMIYAGPGGTPGQLTPTYPQETNYLAQYLAPYLGYGAAAQPAAGVPAGYGAAAPGAAAGIETQANWVNPWPESNVNPLEANALMRSMGVAQPSAAAQPSAGIQKSLSLQVPSSISYSMGSTAADTGTKAGGTWGDWSERYTKSPYYNFLLDKGVQALDRGAAARGRLQSGAEQKALLEYGQGMASTDYDKWLQRWYQSLTPLQSLAGLGQTSASQTASQATTTGQNVAQNYLAAGQAQAAGTLGQANTWANLLNWGGQQALNYGLYNSYNNQNLGAQQNMLIPNQMVQSYSF